MNTLDYQKLSTITYLLRQLQVGEKYCGANSICTYDQYNTVAGKVKRYSVQLTDGTLDTEPSKLEITETMQNDGRTSIEFTKPTNKNLNDFLTSI